MVKINAERAQVEINTLLGLASTLDDETVLQGICEVLELDYTELRQRADNDFSPYQ